MKHTFDCVTSSLFPRAVFKELRDTRVTRFVLACHIDRLEKVLVQAKDMGLMTQYHAYIITSLVSH